MQQNTTAIHVYGTRWCPDSLRAQRLLDQEGASYEFVDIDSDAEAEALVTRTNRGNRSVPTIFFPDGTVFVEPAGGLLRAKIVQLRERGLLAHADVRGA